MLETELRQLLYGVFTRAHRLTLKVEATKYLISILQRVPDDEMDESVRHIAQAYLSRPEGARCCGPACARST